MHAHLGAHHPDDGGTLIVDEFSIDGLDRVDVATINGSLTGYELKSASDSLSRLKRQVPSYSRVMDYLFLVTTHSHLTQARDMIPSWWGIITAKTTPDTILLRQSRQARPNPRIDASAVACLLWRDEALAILTSRGLDARYRTKSRQELCERLANHLTLPQLRQEVSYQIRERRGWRENPEPQQNGETSQREDTIPRFLARRVQTPRR
ncbi:sce7726 family protein [Arthrobacter pigmenti]